MGLSVIFFFPGLRDEHGEAQRITVLPPASGQNQWGV